jgi:hypothetical protein
LTWVGATPFPILFKFLYLISIIYYDIFNVLLKLKMGANLSASPPPVFFLLTPETRHLPVLRSLTGEGGKPTDRIFWGAN